MQNLPLNKLNAVIANVEAGKHTDAANQLRKNILPKWVVQRMQVLCGLCGFV